MNIDNFFQSVEENGASLIISSKHQSNSYVLSNEALFQLPLISLIVLILAKDRRKPNVSEIGQLVGESILSCMTSLNKSDQHIHWSANLRIRTVKAISFLEQANLIIVNNRKAKINITDLGKKVVDKALSWDDNLSYNLNMISRSYRNICVAKKLDLELYETN
ncbi:hypothetical protein L9G74_18895 [Shewanella sp. C32]|uniref:HTH marR-type domain-containing protein n=1 Tax=Shewanella electrica TaxID=515560 RepID=A0ABT2FQ78_9GAMM|nr:hypothetical protein [Shewanella electrica]MCH1926903.1 hypothetical protein [Shewanella electrica]MCS4558507.1 hypothetical protein [Shewanella electrica]